MERKPEPIDFQLLQLIPRSEESLFVFCYPGFLRDTQRSYLSQWIERTFEGVSPKPQVRVVEGGFTNFATKGFDVFEHGVQRFEDTDGA
jgi:hypothetical protein